MRRPSSSWGCAASSRAAAGRGRRHRRRTAARGSSPDGRGRCPSACTACGHHRRPRRASWWRAVPWRAAASWATTTWWISGMLTWTSKISAGSSAVPAFLPVGVHDVDGGHCHGTLPSTAVRTKTRPPLGPGTAPLMQQQALLGVDRVDREVLDGHALATHAAGHLHALEHAAGRRRRRRSSRACGGCGAHRGEALTARGSCGAS